MTKQESTEIAWRMHESYVAGRNTAILYRGKDGKYYAAVKVVNTRFGDQYMEPIFEVEERYSVNLSRCPKVFDVDCFGHRCDIYEFSYV